MCTIVPFILAYIVLCNYCFHNMYIWNCRCNCPSIFLCVSIYFHKGTWTCFLPSSRVHKIWQSSVLREHSWSHVMQNIWKIPSPRVLEKVKVLAIDWTWYRKCIEFSWDAFFTLNFKVELHMFQAYRCYYCSTWS